MNETNIDNNNKEASFDPAPNPEFLREKIKQKPINKRKLLRRSLITILSAAIFGIVACLTFLLLEPFISSRLNTAHQTEKEQAPVETVVLADAEDEISPEDMYATDTEMIEEALQGNVAEVNADIQHIENMISDIKFGVNDYRNLYKELRALSDEVSHSIVTVTGYKTNVDSLDIITTDDIVSSGLIVADNGPSLLILVKDNGLSESDEIRITYYDGTGSGCTIMGKDQTTGYMVLSVYKSSLSASTQSAAVPAPLGTSRTSAIMGTPIIALGSPIGVTGSMDFGIITSGTRSLDMTDSDYTIITTDIVSPANASGIIINLRGMVIGIIDNEYNIDSSTNLLTAFGITELKPLIEKLSNRTPKAYLGIHGTDITLDMRNAYDLPDGIYLKSIDMDSPAMNAGLQNGDILVSVGNSKPSSYHEFISWLYSAKPGDDVTLGILRQSVDKYISLTVNVTLGTTEYSIEKKETEGVTP